MLVVAYPASSSACSETAQASSRPRCTQPDSEEPMHPGVTLIGEVHLVPADHGQQSFPIKGQAVNCLSWSDSLCCND